MYSVNFRNYGKYSSENYGVHTLVFTDAKGNDFWFSYETLVAFSVNGEFHISKNYWGTTTGKHLNWINPNKEIRESKDEFYQNYKRLCGGEA